MTDTSAETQTSGAPPRWLLPVLALLFFCSGFSALIYQVSWLRLLALVFGVTSHAASTVLASFMAGLAVGSYAAGRLADRVRVPLRWFGVAELLVAVSALATPVALAFLERFYAAFYPTLPSGLLPVTLARFLFSSAVLIVPTALMGATLPLIIKSSLMRQARLGTSVGLLYGTNTAGAIAGTLVAGLYLVGTHGIQMAIRTAVVINILVAVGAIAASFRVPASDPVPSSGVAPPARSSSSLRVVMLVFGVSGFVALALEIVWFRVLVLFLRPTTYAFTIMLATVLLGIALGSYLITPFMRRRADWLSVLAIMEITIGVLALLSFVLLAHSYEVMRWVEPYTRRPWIDFLYPLIVASLMAVLPPTVVMGMAFPVGVRMWAERDGDQGHTAARIGQLYAINVAGAILGSLAGGFVFLPSFGARPTLALLASMSLFAGLILLPFVERARKAFVIGAAGVGVFLVTLAWMPDPFNIVLKERYPGEYQVWRAEGVQTTVAVHMQPRGRSKQLLQVLYLDGLHQANDGDTVNVHRRIGHLPLVLHRDPKEALVIGLGGGATAGAVSQHADVQVDVVELSDTVVRGARFFRHVNNNVHDQPNVRVRVDDGRNFLMLTPKKYDVITADIILPVHVGAGNLYSAEYFRLVRDALDEDGVACQWIGPGAATQYKLIMRTFLSVFPETTLWGSDGSLMIGSKRPLRLKRADFERKLTDPARRGALESVGIGSFEGLMKSYLAGPEEMRRFVGEGPTLTDDRPMTEYFFTLPRRERDIDIRGLVGDARAVFEWPE